MSGHLKELEARVFAIRRQLDGLLSAGQITPALYHKGMMKLAYEYVVISHPLEAYQLIVSTVERSYFYMNAQMQMKADPEYFQQATEVLKALQDAGLTPHPFGVLPQKPAQA